MSCKYRWPSYYPPDCPPEPHSPLPGTYYHFVFDPTNVTDEDFKSVIERGMDPSGGMRARCRDCALTLLETPQKAKNFLAQYPSIGPKHIAKVDLNAGGHGVIHPAGDSRLGKFDWWVPEGVSARSFYRGIVRA